MISIILRGSAPFILQIMLLISILLILRGHNFPGGGFIGGLIGSSAVALYTLAYGLKASGFDRKAPWLIFLGAACIFITAVYPFFLGLPLLTGLWVTLHFSSQAVKLGTPLLFDFGVYFLVLGSLTWSIAELEAN